MLESTTFLIFPIVSDSLYSVAWEHTAMSFGTKSHTWAPHATGLCYEIKGSYSAATWEFTQEAMDETCTLGCSAPAIWTL